MLVRIASAVCALLVASTDLAPACADLGSGAVIFEAKCAACHQGGGNILQPGKQLKLSVLERDGYTDVGAMVELLRNGKGQMPKFQGAIPKVSRLTDEELQDVASLVLKRAGEDWK